MIRILVLSAALLCWALPAQAESATPVIASLKPIQSLVAAVMDGDGHDMPSVIVDGRASPHHFSLKPSQMRALQQADIVFYGSPNLESFLGKPLEGLPVRVKRVALIDQPDIALLNARLNTDWEADDDEAPHEKDQHAWLDPQNAIIMVKHIAAVLSETYPEKRALYAANAEREIVRIASIDAALKLRMHRLAGKPFIVFHDAFHYFEKHYGLAGAGSITISDDQTPSAKRLAFLRNKIRSAKAQCVFREPQSESKLVEQLTADTNAKTGVLDDLGAGLPNGAGLYVSLLESIADSLEQCLLKP